MQSVTNKKQYNNKNNFSQLTVVVVPSSEWQFPPLFYPCIM